MTIGARLAAAFGLDTLRASFAEIEWQAEQSSKLMAMVHISRLDANDALRKAALLATTCSAFTAHDGMELLVRHVVAGTTVDAAFERIAEAVRWRLLAR